MLRTAAPTGSGAEKTRVTVSFFSSYSIDVVGVMAPSAVAAHLAELIRMSLAWRMTRDVAVAT